MSFCQNCGAELKDGTKFCEKCGKPVNGTAAAEVPAAGPTVSNPAGAANSRNMKPCKKCGQLVPKKIKRCPYCGAKLKSSRLGIILVLIVVVVIIAVISNSGSSETSETSTTVRSKASSGVEATSAEASSASDAETVPLTTDATDASSDILAYEISDIVETIDESYFGNGTSFNVIVEITNTGSVPIYLEDCTIDYEDDSGHLLQTFDMLSSIPDIVEPGEKGYFYTNGSVSFDEDVVFDNGCNLIPSVTIEKATGSLTKHEVSDISLYNTDYGTVGIKGRIANDTDEDVSLIYVTTVFYGSDGRVLGISGTNVTDIKANGNTSFDDSGIFMDEFTTDDVADYVVYADEMYLQF